MTLVFVVKNLPINQLQPDPNLGFQGSSSAQIKISLSPTARPTPTTKPKTISQKIPTSTSTPSPQPTTTPSPTTNQQDNSNNQQNNPAPTPTLAPVPTSNPCKVSPVQVPDPTNTGQPWVVCEVRGEQSSCTAPATVNFIYGARGSGFDYVTNVQWDFDGDGTWDTPMDLAGQRASYTYTKPGNYTVKMHLQTKGGPSSNVCTGTFGLGGN